VGVVSEVFFDDPYDLSAAELVPPPGFDERLRPLVMLYEIGQSCADNGVLAHHTPIGSTAIGVILNEDGRVVRMASAGELPKVIPSSTRSRQVLPHLGADDLGKLLASQYRPVWLSELETLGGIAALSLAKFIGSLPIYDKRDSAAKTAKRKPDPDAVNSACRALADLGLVVDAKIFLDEVFPTVVALDETGLVMCAKTEWRNRHISLRGSGSVSKHVGRCSVTGEISPLARLTPNVQGLSALMGGTGRSSVVSVNLKTFEGLYRDGIRDAALSVPAVEMIAIGLGAMLSDSSVVLHVGRHSASKRKVSFTRGKEKKPKHAFVSMLGISERFGTNAPENLLTALERTIRAPWEPDRKADDGTVLKGRFLHPELDRLLLLEEASVVIAVFGGSSGGISFDAWHEMSGVLAGQRVTAWSRAQQLGSGQKYGFDVHGLSIIYALGAGDAFLRSITHGEPIPAWVARSALDELFKPGGLELSPRTNKFLSTLGLFLLGTTLAEQENRMSSLRDTPAFRLGAWLGAIQTAWEKGVGEGKQDSGPISGIRSLASKPGARWAELTFRYEESIGPKVRTKHKWADVAVSKAAQAFLDLNEPFPDTLTTVDQATFVLGYQSRWERASVDQNTSETNNSEVTTS
jgi:hypothetical protein